MKKLRVIFGIVFGLLFGVFTYFVRNYDLAQIGPAGTSIGFSKFNHFVHETTGVNMLWYEITDYLGYLAIAVAGVFAILGFIQMIKRRSLFKVDREIIALGGLFVVVIGLYVVFEKVVINYRPILMDGSEFPEASYPSSHTMLIVVVIGAAMMLIEHYLSKGTIRTLLSLLGVVIILVTIGGRLYCGVHWLTDIIGGILLSISLLEFYSAIIAGGSDAGDSGNRSSETGRNTATFTNTSRNTRRRSRRIGRSRAKSRNATGPSTKGYVPKH